MRVIKLLSLKTRRADLSRAAFRDYYEGHHVPLGLTHLDHFRWRKYVRNHLLADAHTHVGIDCYTEFWIASREDQAATRAFVASSAFAELDGDDRTFLDVSRRAAFEVEEQLLAGEPRGVEPPGARRRVWFLSRTPGMSDAECRARVLGHAADVVSGLAGRVRRITLDLPLADNAADRPLDALLTVWPEAATLPEDAPAPAALRASSCEVEMIETAPAHLYVPRGDRPCPN